MFHSIYIFMTKILVKLYSKIKTYLSTLSSPYSLCVYGDILGDTGPPDGGMCLWWHCVTRDHLMNTLQDHLTDIVT